MAYKYQEYPKWVEKPDGSRVVVENAEQEAALLPKPKPEAKPKKFSDVS